MAFHYYTITNIGGNKIINTNIINNTYDNNNNDTTITSDKINTYLARELKIANETNNAILKALNTIISNKGKNYKDITIGEWVLEWFNNYALNTSNKKYVKGKLSTNEYYISKYRIKYILEDKVFSNLKLDEVSSSDIYLFLSNIKSQRKKLIKDNIINNKTTTNSYLDYDGHYYSYDVIINYYKLVSRSFNLEPLDKDIYKGRINTIKDYYLNKNNNDEMSFKSKKNICDLLRMAFKCATNMEIIKESPFLSFSYGETKEIESKTQEALTTIERDIFLKVSENNKYFDCYLLMVYTGMRKSEALGLTKKDIYLSDSNDKNNNDDNNYIVVSKQLFFNKDNKYSNKKFSNSSNRDITTITKSMHSIRKIPLGNNEVIEMLKRRCNKLNSDDEFIFGDIDEYMYLTYNQIYKEVKRLYSICFLITGNKKYLTCHNHTLRHTFATLFLDSYPNYLVQVSAILGHSNTSFTAKQYVHLETEKIDVSLLKDRNK